MSGAIHPGSGGEHELQRRHGTSKRAAAFYDKQMLDHLNPLMRDFIAAQTMAFIATSDAHGDCDCSFRAGPPGFMRVLDERTLMYPDYRGNGVMASMGNISENGHVGILFVDFFESTVGLHVNGRASIVENDALAAFEHLLDHLPDAAPALEPPEDLKRTPERWIVVRIEEAYIHCSKHIPLLEHVAGPESRGASGDFFKAKASPRPWTEQDEPQPVREPDPVVGELGFTAAPRPPAVRGPFLRK